MTTRCGASPPPQSIPPPPPRRQPRACADESTKHTQRLGGGTSADTRFRRFWEALSGICSRTIQHPESQVNRLCISPDKRYLAAAGHHTVKLYDIKSSNPNAVLTFDGHTGNVTGVAFHCEGKWMVTSSEDGTVKIWETRSGSIQRNYNHGSPVNDVVIHPNQGEIISCDRSGSVRIWDLAENNCSHEIIPEEEQSVASVTVASDGSLLCAANNSVRAAPSHLAPCSLNLLTPPSA